LFANHILRKIIENLSIGENYHSSEEHHLFIVVVFYCYRTNQSD